MTLPYSVQGGYKNYHQNPGKVRTVELPENWQSGPGEPTTHPAFITEEEQALLRKANLHNKSDPNDIGRGRGPGNLPSYDGYGEQSSRDAGTSAAAGGGHSAPGDYSGGRSVSGVGSPGDIGAYDPSTGSFSDYGSGPAQGTNQTLAALNQWSPQEMQRDLHERQMRMGMRPTQMVMSGIPGVAVTDSSGQAIGSGMSSPGYGPAPGGGWSPLAETYSTASTPEAYGPPMAPEIDTTDMSVAEIEALAAELNTSPDWSAPMGPLSHAMSPTEQFAIAEQAAEEADSGFMDSLSDFVFSPNEVVYDDEGFPHMSAHAYDFFNSGLTKGLLGLASPVLGGVYSVGSSIANDNPAELAYGVLGRIAAPFSVVDLGTKALSWADVGENLSFSDLDPRGFDAEGALASLSPSNMYDNAMSWYDGLDTGTTLTGGSANDAFGGGAANYGTPAPAPSYSVGGDTGQVVDPTTVPSMFTMLGEQIAHNDPFWYGGKRFFDEGEQVDIGDSYGLA